MSHRISAAVAVAGLAAGTAEAQVTFVFPIEVSQSTVPSTIPTGFSPSGTGSVTVDDATNTVSWNIVYDDLTGPIVSPGGHIHGPAAIGATAGTIIDLAGNTGATDPIGGIVPLPQPASGTLIGSAIVPQSTVDAILGGQAYVNLHTELNPAGEIRGQIVPEPASLGLLGLAGLGLVRRRRA